MPFITDGEPKRFKKLCCKRSIDGWAEMEAVRGSPETSSCIPQGSNVLRTSTVLSCCRFRGHRGAAIYEVSR